MSPNHKLSKALKGRTVAAFEGSKGIVALHFLDGTQLRIKGMSASSGALPSQTKVIQVFEQGSRLELHLEDGSTILYDLNDPGNSVAVRDATGKAVYMG